MQDDNNHITFTAEDIRRYHEGNLSPAEMHAMEKAALEDPFLADAMEGYSTEGVSVTTDISELKNRLEKRIEGKDKAKLIPMATTPLRWMRVAAMIVALAGAGLLVYNLGFNKTTTEIAQHKSELRESVSPSLKQMDDSLADQAISTPVTDDKISTESISDQTNHARVKEAETSEAKQSLAKANSVVKQKESPPASAATETLKNSDGILDTEDDRLEVMARNEAQAKKESAYLLKQQDSIDADKRMMASAAKPTAREQNNNAKKFMANGGDNSSRARKQSAIPSSNVFRGVITDAQNNPLPFANITNNQDNVGTYADARGHFVLTSPDSVMDVQVKSLGFENLNVQLKNGLVINRVVLKDDTSVPAIVLSKKTVNTKQRENNMVLEEPEPADGWLKYDTYLANNLKVPDDYKGGRQQGGEVELSFEVNHLGEPINIKVEKSLCEICDKEAIRLLKEGPKWKQKAKKGKRTSITIPF